MTPDVLNWLNEHLTEDDVHQLLALKVGPPVVKPGKPTIDFPAFYRIPKASLRYSTIDPWNIDRSAMVLEHEQGAIWLHDEIGRPHLQLPGVNASSEIVWSNDPTIFYFVDRNNVRRFDTSKDWNQGAITTVKTFHEYVELAEGDRNGVRAMGEGDLIGGRYWALAGTLPSGEIDFFAFDCKTGSTGARVKLPGVDGLYRTPDGNVLVTYPHANGKGRFKGVELFDKDMNFLRQIVTAFGHGDVGRDEAGDECWVYANANDPNPIAPNAAVSVKLADPSSQTMLVSVDWDGAMHISCSEQNGVALISTFDDQAGDSRARNVDELILYRRGTVTSLGKHGSHGGTYGGQPQAVLHRSGTACAWNQDEDVCIRSI